MRASRTGLIAVGLLLGSSGLASAVPVVSVEFQGGLTNTITIASSSSVFTASVYIDLTGEPGTVGYSLSVDFDTSGENVLDFIGGTECKSLLQATASHPNGEAFRVVIATFAQHARRRAGKRCPAKLGSTDNQRLIQHAALS